MSKPDNEPPDLVEVLEAAEERRAAPPKAHYGYHQPDYSLVADEKLILSKASYPTLPEAQFKAAEKALAKNLMIRNHVNTERFWVFECFKIISKKEDK